MTPRELDAKLRTVLAQLELVSSAPCSRYDPSGGDGGTGDVPSVVPPVERYRKRLAGIDKGLQRRLDATEAEGHEERRDREKREAFAWHHQARLEVLDSATKELASSTGRDGIPPERHAAPMDTREGVEAAVRDDAPGKPADHIARQFGLTTFTVRRWYVQWELNPLDGSPISTTKGDQDAKVAALKAKGLTSRQIATLLGMHQTQVIRVMKRVA